MRKGVIVSLLVIGLMSVSCGNKKKAVENNEVVEMKNTETNNEQQAERRNSKVTVELVDMSQDIKSDPFTILDAHIDGNKLHLTVQYGGGCGDHSFTVLGSKMIMKSMPPQRPVMIVHDAGGDRCRALLTEELVVDISELAYTKQDGSEIFLIMEGREKIMYVYESEETEER